MWARNKMGPAKVPRTGSSAGGIVLAGLWAVEQCLSGLQSDRSVPESDETGTSERADQHVIPATVGAPHGVIPGLAELPA